MTTAPPETVTPQVASTLDDFVEWLASFPDADRLASWLETHGVTGQIGLATRCPLSRLATAFVGEQMRVSTTTVADAATRDTWKPLPAVAKRFVEEFDGGHYPGIAADPPQIRII